LNKILNNSCPHLGIDFIFERRAERYGRTQFGYHRQAASRGAPTEPRQIGSSLLGKRCVQAC
jgi:hypothetical protein